MPQSDNQGRRLVQISVVSKRIEDLEEFMAALEKTGAFSGVLSRNDQPDEDGTLQSDIQAYYSPSTAAAPPSTSDSGKGKPANETAANVSAGAPR
jgi:hypothetical protein